MAEPGAAAPARPAAGDAGHEPVGVAGSASQPPVRTALGRSAAARKPITIGLGEPFSTSVTVAIGAIFQLPVVMLILGRVGVLASTTLRSNRRYAIVALAGLAAALPGTDPVTTLLELVPLLALYELSIVLLRAAERRKAAEQVLHISP